MAISYLDYLLLPVYIFLIYFLFFRIRDKFYPVGHKLRPYFIAGLTAKMLGALFISLLYVYYYGVGDTIGYYQTSLIINSVLDEKGPIAWANILFKIPAWYDGNYYEYTSRMLSLYEIPANHMPAAIAAVLGLLCFKTFLPTALLFASIAYPGAWVLFRALSSYFKERTNLVAIAVLYTPSAVIWSSGIFKDTICMFCLGWVVFIVFRMLIEKKYNILYILFLILNIYIISIVKIYILIAFMPALVFWILQTYASKVQNKFSKNTIRIVIPIIIVSSTLYILNKFEGALGEYALNNVDKYSQALRNNLLSESIETNGSGYDLGTVEPGLTGLLKKFPQAVNVTLFRPYIWESRKLIILLSSLESTFFLLTTLYLIYNIGLIKIAKFISKDNLAQFCLLFTIIFAFATGISTYNFGTLSRYKIPCLPFYAVLLIQIYDYGNREKNLMRNLKILKP